MANIDIAAKNPGDLHSSTEFNTQISWANAPGKSLGAFTGAMDFGSQGQYDDFTMTGPLVLTASNIALFNVQVVRITTDGINDITFGIGIDKVITPFVNPLPVGDYWFYMASFVSPGGSGSGVHVSIPEIQAVTPTYPVILSMTVEDAAPNDLIVTFDSVVTGTNIGYSFNVNAAPRNLTGLTGSGTDTWTFTFDGAAILVTDTLTSSYDKSTGDTKNGLLFDLQSFTDTPVTNNISGGQLSTPTGLTATAKAGGGVTLDYDAIDANADDVAVQRSLSSGTGFATIQTISRALVTIDDDTGTFGTTYYYRLIANGSGSYNNSDPSAEASAAPTSIIFSDTFTGSTIDTGKWTVVNPDTSDIAFTQNNNLIVTAQGNNTTLWNANRLETILNFNLPSNGCFAIDCPSGTGNQGLEFGLFVGSSGGGSTVLMIRDKQGAGLVNTLIRDASANTLVSTDDADTIVGKTIRIENVSGVVSTQYWNGSSWTTWQSVDTLSDIDTDLEVQIRLGDYDIEIGPTITTFDNVYVTSATYTAQYPL